MVTAAALAYSVSYVIQSSMGQSIQKIIYQPQNANETSNTIYDTPNPSGTKVNGHQTFMDSQPLQDSVLSCVTPAPVGSYEKESKFCESSVTPNNVPGWL